MDTPHFCKHTTTPAEYPLGTPPLLSYRPFRFTNQTSPLTPPSTTPSVMVILRFGDVDFLCFGYTFVHGGASLVTQNKDTILPHLCRPCHQRPIRRHNQRIGRSTESAQVVGQGLVLELGIELGTRWPFNRKCPVPSTLALTGPSLTLPPSQLLLYHRRSSS